MGKTIERLEKRLRKLEQNYYNWRHYFEEKKRRYKARFERKSVQSAQFYSIIKHLEKLKIKGMKTVRRNDRRKKYILTLTHNDITRLQNWLTMSQYPNRRRKGYVRIFLKPSQRNRLMRLLNRN